MMSICVALFGLLPIASALTVSPTTHFASPQIAPLLRPAPALCRRAAPAPHMSDVIAPWIEPSVTSAAVFGIANTLGFGISVATGSHLHLDLIGTGVFAASALVLRGATRSQNLSAAAIALWSAKLASFLFYRVLQTKHDARLGDMLSTVSGAATFWVASFLWGWLVSLPHTLAAGVPVAARPAGVPLLAKFGALMFAAGFAVETVADLQKWAFKNDAANAGKYCGVGLWKMSQHPNWAGNLLLWSGILVINAPTLLAAVRRAARRARRSLATRTPSRRHTSTTRPAAPPPPPPPPPQRALMTRLLTTSAGLHAAVATKPEITAAATCSSVPSPSAGRRCTLAWS